MICSNCGTENKAGRKFCIQCGSNLAAACATCGSPLEAQARFCGECGAPVGQTGATAVPAVAVSIAPVAERRLVSVLFADLVGFTTLAEGRDAEDTRELLSQYFDLARDIVTRYGGTVEKFIGDAVMAVWGAPTAHEDDAERAVRAALELVDAVKALEPPIQARGGVLTGEAAVTVGATNQGMVAGDLVNTASRLQAVAAPGTVLVGEATQRATSRAITFEAAGERLLKGKTSPVAAWRALRVVAERGGRNRSEVLEAPFVGRDDELRLLKDMFHATTREGRARLISVIGPAGIGKTRLAWEFLKYLDGLVETVWYHDGRSPAYGDGISFWALGEMVRRRAGLLETDDEATTRAKVAVTLDQHVPDAGERRWLEAAILTLLGIEGAGGSEQLFAAWRTFFERLAASAPVVLVFEDFHYADAGLIDFVDHLLEWSRNLPIYVVTLARPELLDKRHEWGAGKRNFTSLYLEPLSKGAMRELLAGLVPGLPAPAVDAIVGRADGIPLYAVETVRMLVAQGRVAVEGTTYLPVGDLTSLAVPETLTALIASRLDSLDPADRALVSDAAVLGQSFTVAGLSAVSGIGDAELEPRLMALVRRELLTMETDTRSPEHGQYAFVQALIREVAANTLAKRDRKVRHLAAARFFESLGTEEIAGALASHYLAAYENAAEGPEADALAGQARLALKGAAERASALGSHDQAITLLRQAIAVTTDPAEQAELHERAAESAEAVSRVEEAETHFRAAIDRRAELGDIPGQAHATAGLGRTLLTAYRFDQALGLLAKASEEFTGLSDDPSLVRLNGQLARAYFLNDDDASAVAAADRVLETAERLDLVEVVADTLVTRGSALASLGRRYEGLGAIQAGGRLAASHALPRIEHRALNNLSAYLLDSDPRAALGAAREGMAIAARLGDRSFQLVDNAVTAAQRTGEWDWATGQLEQLLADEIDPVIQAVAGSDLVVFRALRGLPTVDLMADLEALPGGGADSVRPTASVWSRAWIAFSAGRFDLARTDFHRYTEEFSQAMTQGSLLAACCALLSGDAHAVREELHRSELDGLGGAARGADRMTLRAGIVALEGPITEALPLYREALGAWRDLGLAWDEALCGLEMVLLLDPTEPEVRAVAQSAGEILTRLGATPFLARLEAAMQGPSPPAAAPTRARDASTVSGTAESARGAS